MVNENVNFLELFVPGHLTGFGEHGKLSVRQRSEKATLRWLGKMDGFECVPIDSFTMNMSSGDANLGAYYHIA